MSKKMTKLSIVIPVYNEKKTILKVLKAVSKSKTFSLKKEIIIVDDGSTDGTKELLINYQRKFKKLLLLINDRNFGKGASIVRGLLQSTGDVVVIQDADLEYSPAEYPNLITPIYKGYADVVYGSRFINSSPHRVLYFYHYLGNKFITSLSNFLTNLNL
ncbi:glycosyl transferase, partial [Candidatus Gottesmanbacteria bacterium RBG_13_37_7]